MMPLRLETPQELAMAVAERARAERLARGWSQVELAERAGIAIETYRLFERRGRISLERLLAIAVVLGAPRNGMRCSDRAQPAHSTSSMQAVPLGSGRRRCTDRLPAQRGAT
jgi:transcriptional regulator with XRE-family HTH domain